MTTAANSLQPSEQDAQTTAEKLLALVAEAQDLQRRDPQRALEQADLGLALIGERKDLLKEKSNALNAKGGA
ncbi:MAG: hypothetical protein NZM06_00435, partial [Chloroherpetonaceae bacterium]|nr:hypothetical protein [Chloroherpetonaceae bacterium]